MSKYGNTQVVPTECRGGLHGLKASSVPGLKANPDSLNLKAEFVVSAHLYMNFF